MSKFKIGTGVRPTKKYITWYRSQLFSLYQISGKMTDAETAIMWAMADVERPEGEVISGIPAEPKTTVKVRLSNRYGSYEGYVEKDNLLRKRWVK